MAIGFPLVANKGVYASVEGLSRTQHSSAVLLADLVPFGGALLVVKAQSSYFDSFWLKVITALPPEGCQLVAKFELAIVE